MSAAESAGPMVCGAMDAASLSIGSEGELGSGVHFSRELVPGLFRTLGSVFRADGFELVHQLQQFTSLALGFFFV